MMNVLRLWTEWKTTEAQQKLALELTINTYLFGSETLTQMNMEPCDWYMSRFPYMFTAHFMLVR